jgi:hypothetical protein
MNTLIRKLGASRVLGNWPLASARSGSYGDSTALDLNLQWGQWLHQDKESGAIEKK